MTKPKYEPTSERVSEEHYQARDSDYLIYLFHVATYDFAVPFVEKKRVLDFGCGTGYGAHRIASACTTITGVDVAPDAIAFARERYRADNLEFHEVTPLETRPLPFPDAAFDAVLSFQVIEHVPDVDRYMLEVKRVLTADGTFVVATPDRTNRLFRGQRPWNRYHRVEFSPDDVASVLGRRFPSVEINGMGGDPVLIGRELGRSQRLKWVTFPFTFPGSPEPWRQFGLATLKRGETWLQRRSQVEERVSEPEGSAGGAGAIPEGRRSLERDLRSIRIAPGVQPSVNVVCVARSAPTD